MCRASQACCTCWKALWPRPFQFFVTDSTTHFMRGSLYFNHAPNPDSVAPVLDRMEADVRRIMETIEWS